MTGTQELYSLGTDRSARFAISFLDKFLPNRESVSEEYPVPESDDNPRMVFTTDIDILTYLENNPAEPYALYWNDSNPSVYDQAMLFYTRDGKVIYGLACEDNAVEEKAVQLREFTGSPWFLRGWEQRPPDTSEGFINLCRKTN